jgi:hypothetical protein
MYPVFHCQYQLHLFVFTLSTGAHRVFNLHLAVCCYRSGMCVPCVAAALSPLVQVRAFLEMVHTAGDSVGVPLTPGWKGSARTDPLHMEMEQWSLVQVRRCRRMTWPARTHVCSIAARPCSSLFLSFSFFLSLSLACSLGEYQTDVWPRGLRHWRLLHYEAPCA